MQLLVGSYQVPRIGAIHSVKRSEALSTQRVVVGLGSTHRGIRCVSPRHVTSRQTKVAFFCLIMVSTLAIDVIGYVGGSVIALSSPMQLIKSWKTQRTGDIAW